MSNKWWENLEDGYYWVYNPMMDYTDMVHVNKLSRFFYIMGWPEKFKIDRLKGLVLLSGKLEAPEPPPYYQRGAND